MFRRFRWVGHIHRMQIIDTYPAYHSEEESPKEETRREDEEEDACGDKGDRKESSQAEDEKRKKFNQSREISTATKLLTIQDHGQSYAQITFR